MLALDTYQICNVYCARCENISLVLDIETAIEKIYVYSILYIVFCILYILDFRKIAGQTDWTQFFYFDYERRSMLNKIFIIEAPMNNIEDRSVYKVTLISVRWLSLSVIYIISKKKSFTYNMIYNQNIL